MTAATTRRTDIEGPVLVTGGASGIGREVVRQLRALPVAVGVLDRDPPDDGEVFASRVDLRDAQAVEEAVDAQWRHFGALAGVVNCAGVYPVTPFLDLEPAEWDEVMAVNLRAPYLVTRAVARRMVAAGRGGVVVNVSSTSATLCRPGVAHYGASKAGLSQLTRDMALELAPRGIRVNAVAPGLIATERVMAKARGEAAAEHAAKLARIPLSREGLPAEIAALVLMLLSSTAGYLTGSIVLADGGMTLGIPAY